MNWFIEWIPRGTEIKNGKLNTMLKDWEKTFATPYKNRISSIKSGTSTVQTRVKNVSTKVDSIKKSICAKNACKGKTASTYLKNGQSAIPEAYTVTDLMQLQLLFKLSKTCRVSLLQRMQQTKRESTSTTIFSETSKPPTTFHLTFLLPITSTISLTTEN